VMKKFVLKNLGLKNYRVKTITALLLLIMAVTIAIMGTIKSPQQVEVKCTSAKCFEVSNLNQNGPRTNFPQSFHIQLKINGDTKDSKPNGESVGNIDSLRVIKGQTNNLLVLIPMATQPGEPFGVSVPISKSSKFLKVDIFEGREFVITLDDNLVYSHRYLTPVFNLNPNNLWISALDDINSNSLLTPVRASLAYSKSSSIDRKYLYFLILFLFVTLSSLIKILLQAWFPQRSRYFLFGISTYVLIIFWVINLTTWIVGPRDDTGSRHPSPFGPIGPALSDMMQIFQAGMFKKPYIYSAVNYPPLSLALIRIVPFISIGILVLLLSALSLGILWWLSADLKMNNKNGSSLGYYLVFVIPYPVVCALVRGNIDLLASVLVGISVLREKRNCKLSAGLFIGFAIGLKVWPVVFLLYFLKRRRFKICLISISFAAVLTFVSFCILGYTSPLIQISLLLKTLGYFNGASSYNTFIYSYSLSALIFVLMLTKNIIFNKLGVLHSVSDSLHFFSSFEYIIIFSLFLLILLVLIFRSKSNDSIFLYCSGIALLCSSLSYTYRGSILVIALIMRTKYSPDILRMNLSETSNITSLKLFYRSARQLEKFAWVCILAPTTFVYAPNSLLSTSSVLQPLSLMYLLGVEFYYERQTQRSSAQSRKIL